MNNLDVNALMVVGDLPGTEECLPAVVEPLVLKETVSNPGNRTLDLDEDYSNVRKMLYFQQQMLMEAATVSLEQARTADAPRVMEVFSTLMGQMTITNKELLKVHKDMKDITSEQVNTGANSSPSTPAANITATNVFLGTPSELMNKVGTQYDAIDVET
ncbi:MAG: terminase small subunit [Bacilli bacterium]